jgi:hypothetical protein
MDDSCVQGIRLLVCIVTVGCAGQKSPTVVAKSQNSPRATASVGSTIYWTTRTGISTLEEGSSAVSITDVAAIQPTEIVADETAVYWIDAGTAGGSDGKVSRLTVADGTIAQIAANLAGLSQIALDSDFVYWTTSSGVFRCARVDGMPSEIVGSPVPARGIAVNSSTVFWSLQSGEVDSAPLDGGSVTHLATGAAPFHLAADDAALYWGEDVSGGSVLKLMIGAEQPMLIAADQDVVSSLSARDSRVAWSTLLGGTVVTATSDGALEVLAAGEPGAGGVALADRATYWANENSGAVEMATF